MQELKDFTPEELSKYDGSDPSKPIYIAVLGQVFDVTEGKEYYGPEGGYKFFAGRGTVFTWLS
jgi:predicted heme/steroid binding protein